MRNNKKNVILRLFVLIVFMLIQVVGFSISIQARIDEQQTVTMKNKKELTQENIVQNPEKQMKKIINEQFNPDRKIKKKINQSGDVGELNNNANPEFSFVEGVSGYQWYTQVDIAGWDTINLNNIGEDIYEQTTVLYPPLFDVKFDLGGYGDSRRVNLYYQPDELEDNQYDFYYTNSGGHPTIISSSDITDENEKWLGYQSSGILVKPGTDITITSLMDRANVAEEYNKMNLDIYLRYFDKSGDLIISEKFPVKREDINTDTGFELMHTVPEDAVSLDILYNPYINADDIDGSHNGTYDDYLFGVEEASVYGEYPDNELEGDVEIFYYSEDGKDLLKGSRYITGNIGEVVSPTIYDMDGYNYVGIDGVTPIRITDEDQEIKIIYKKDSLFNNIELIKYGETDDGEDEELEDVEFILQFQITTSDWYPSLLEKGDWYEIQNISLDPTDEDGEIVLDKEDIRFIYKELEELGFGEEDVTFRFREIQSPPGYQNPPSYSPKEYEGYQYESSDLDSELKDFVVDFQITVGDDDEDKSLSLELVNKMNTSHEESLEIETSDMSVPLGTKIDTNQVKKYITSVELLENGKTTELDSYSIDDIVASDSVSTNVVGSGETVVNITGIKEDKEIKGIASIPTEVTWGNDIWLGGGTNPANESTLALSLINNGNNTKIVGTYGDNTKHDRSIHSSFLDEDYYQIDYFSREVSSPLNLTNNLDQKGTKSLVLKGKQTPEDAVKGWGTQVVKEGDIIRVWMKEDKINWYQNGKRQTQLSDFPNRNLIYFEVTKDGFKPLYNNQVKGKMNISINQGTSEDTLNGRYRDNPKELLDIPDQEIYKSIQYSMDKFEQYPDTSTIGKDRKSNVIMTGQTENTFGKLNITFDVNPTFEVVESQNPLRIETNVKRDNKPLKDGKIILESRADDEWTKFDPEPDHTSLANKYWLSDEDGNIIINQDDSVVPLIQKYGSTANYKKFRFRLIDTPDSQNKYLPAPPRYGVYQGGDPSKGLENFISEEFTLSGNSIGTQEIKGINQQKSSWGTSPWYIDNNKVLHIESGNLSTNNGDLGMMWSPITFGIIREDIRVVQFDGNVSAPENSRALLHGFKNMKNFKNLERLDTAHVTNMYQFFAQNYLLEELVLPSNFNSSNVTDMQYMLQNNYNMHLLDIKPLDTSKLTDMKGMFNRNDSLDTLILGDNFKFLGTEANLPAAPTKEPYTGKWVRKTPRWVGTNQDLMSNKPSPMGGVYVWEQKEQWLPSYSKWKDATSNTIPKTNTFMMMKTQETFVSDVVGLTHANGRYHFSSGEPNTPRSLIYHNVGYSDGSPVSVRITLSPNAEVADLNNNFIGFETNFMSIGVKSKLGVPVEMSVKYEFLDDNNNPIKLSGYWTVSGLNQYKRVKLPNKQIENIYSYARGTSPQTTIQYEEDDKNITLIGTSEVVGNTGEGVEATITYNDLNTFDFVVIPSKENDTIQLNYNQSSIPKVGIPDPQPVKEVIDKITKDNRDNLNNKFIQYIPFQSSNNRNQDMTWTVSNIKNTDIFSSGDWEVYDETGKKQTDLFEFDKVNKTIKPKDLSNSNLYNHYYRFVYSLPFDESKEIQENQLVEQNNGKYLNYSQDISLKVDSLSPVVATPTTDINFMATINYSYTDEEGKPITMDGLAKTGTSLITKPYPVIKAPDIQGYTFNKSEPSDLMNKKILYTDNPVNFIYDKINKVQMTVNYYQLDRDGKETTHKVIDNLQTGETVNALVEEVEVGEKISKFIPESDFNSYLYKSSIVTNDVTEESIEDDIVPTNNFTVNRYYQPLENLSVPKTISFGDKNAQRLKDEYSVKDDPSPINLTSGYSDVNWSLHASSDGLFSEGTNTRLLSDMYFRLNNEKMIINKEDTVLASQINKHYYDLPLVTEDNKEGLFLEIGNSGTKDSKYSGKIKFSMVTGP